MIWSFVVKLWDLFNCTLRCCWTLCDEFDILLSFKFCKLSAHSCYCWIDVSELLRVFTDRPFCSHAAPTSIRKIIIHYKYPFLFLSKVSFHSIDPHHLQALFAGSIPEIISIVKGFPKYSGTYVSDRGRRFAIIDVLQS